jgi:hypothetical protein
MALIRVLLVCGVLCALALADEIIGKFQFDRLCDKAKAITYAGAVPVGYDFYSREGRWLLTLPKAPPEAKKKAAAAYQSLVKWELVQIQRTSEWIPIGQTDTRIFDKRNGVLLASFSAYGTRGGWISRQFEKPLLVKEECLPAEIRVVNTKILPFQKPAFEPPPEPKEEAPKPPAAQPVGATRS